MDSQNAFPKSKILNAAKRALLDIEVDREQLKQKSCAGHREFWLFGRELTVEEAWAKLSWATQMAVRSLYGRHETYLKAIIAAAPNVVGDTMNLTLTEFSLLEEYWEE